MATIYDVFKAINQAAADARDGAHDERFVHDGEDKKVGLKREVGCPLKDTRVMDGFNVKVGGDKLIVSYQAEMPISDFHNEKLDQELESMFSQIESYLKKEYKKYNKEALNLKSEGDCKFTLQNISRVRNWVEAQKCYKVGNLSELDEVAAPSKDNLEKTFKDFLSKGTDK